MNEELLLKLALFLDSVIGESSNTPTVTDTEVVKSTDEMEKRALFVVLEPSEADGTTTDLHEDWYSEEDILKACNNFNTQCRQAGLMHDGLLSNEHCVIEQSYTTLSDMTLDTGEFVKKGTWVQWWKFHDDELWSGVLDGTYNGVSIECSAKAFDIK